MWDGADTKGYARRVSYHRPARFALVRSTTRETRGTRRACSPWQWLDANCTALIATQAPYEVGAQCLACARRPRYTTAGSQLLRRAVEMTVVRPDGDCTQTLMGPHAAPASLAYPRCCGPQCLADEHQHTMHTCIGFSGSCGSALPNSPEAYELFVVYVEQVI